MQRTSCLAIPDAERHTQHGDQQHVDHAQLASFTYKLSLPDSEGAPVAHNTAANCHAMCAYACHSPLQASFDAPAVPQHPGRVLETYDQHAILSMHTKSLASTGCLCKAARASTLLAPIPANADKQHGQTPEGCTAAHLSSPGAQAWLALPQQRWRSRNATPAPTPTEHPLTRRQHGIRRACPHPCPMHGGHSGRRCLTPCRPANTDKLRPSTVNRLLQQRQGWEVPPRISAEQTPWP
jgi:hypothetical protein